MPRLAVVTNYKRVGCDPCLGYSPWHSWTPDGLRCQGCHTLKPHSRENAREEEHHIVTRLAPAWCEKRAQDLEQEKGVLPTPVEYHRGIDGGTAT